MCDELGCRRRGEEAALVAKSSEDDGEELSRDEVSLDIVQIHGGQ